jgi:hypothetical protein
MKLLGTVSKAGSLGRIIAQLSNRTESVACRLELRPAKGVRTPASANARTASSTRPAAYP